jgi:hypothetical protein
MPLLSNPLYKALNAPVILLLRTRVMTYGYGHHISLRPNMGLLQPYHPVLVEVHVFAYTLNYSLRTLKLIF